MSEMVEKVAEALTRYILTQHEDGVTKGSQTSLALARVAMEAMREPTYSMLDAGHDAWISQETDDEDSHVITQPVWRAMIDNALR